MSYCFRPAINDYSLKSLLCQFVAIFTYYFVHLLTVVPQLTNEIQDWIERVAHKPLDGCTPDVCVIEVSAGFILPIHTLCHIIITCGS